MKFAILFFCILLQSKVGFSKLPLDFLSSFSLAIFVRKNNLTLSTISLFIKDILELNPFPWNLMIFYFVVFLRRYVAFLNLREFPFYLLFFLISASFYLFRNSDFPFHYYFILNLGLVYFFKQYV